MLKTKSGIFLFNIIPSYRPGMGKVFDHGYYDLACIPSLAQRTKQNTLYTSLEDIAGESLSDLDLLYIMATDGTGTFAKINWVSPGDFQAVEHGTVTFTEDGGIKGNAVDGYWDTTWDPDTDGVNFTQNSGSWFFYNNNNSVTSGTIGFGSVGNAANNNNGLNGGYIRNGANHSFGVNAAALTAISSGIYNAFFHKSRTGSALSKLFKNGSQLGANDTTASTTLSTQDITILAYNARGSGVIFHSDAQIGIWGIGASLTGQESALYTAWDEYFQSL